MGLFQINIALASAIPPFVSDLYKDLVVYWPDFSKAQTILSTPSVN